MKYNHKVLEKYAARLYRSAEMAIICWSFGGLISAFFLNSFLYGPKFLSTDNLSILFLLTGVMIGLLIGLSRTLEIRARAQRDLCMVEIEKHLKELLSYQKSIENPPEDKENKD